MTDDRFDAELHAFLRSRQAGVASPALRARLGTVTSTGDRARRFRFVPALGTWAAVLAFAVVGFAAIVSIGNIVGVGPGATPDSTPSPDAPLPVDGVGLATAGMAWGHLALLLIACTGLALALALIRSKWIVSLLVGVTVTAVLLGGRAAIDTRVGWVDGSWSAGVGFQVQATGSGLDPDSGDEHAYYFGVGEGELFTFGFTVTNVGSLPVTLLGMAREQYPEINYRLVGLGLPRPEAGRHPDSLRSALPENMVPFEPIVIEPDRGRFIVVAGRGGPCAEPAIADSDDRAAVGFESITLVYSVLGWERTAVVELPHRVFIPVRMNCLG